MLCILNISNFVVQMLHDRHGAVLNFGQYGSKKTTTTTTYQLALFIFAFQISAFDATPNHILGGNKLQRFNAFFFTNNTGSLIHISKKSI